MRNLSIAVFTRGQFWPSGIVVACVCPCGRQSRACPRDNLSLVPARITKFEPDMQNNLVKIPIVLGIDWSWPSRSNLTLKSKFTQFLACPHDHSTPVEVRISKFWPIMHLSSVKIPVNFGIDWYWSSISFLILKPIFLPNLFALFLEIFSEIFVCNVFSETIADDRSAFMAIDCTLVLS